MKLALVLVCLRATDALAQGASSSQPALPSLGRSEPAGPWQDSQALERGQRMLERLFEAAGGIAAWNEGGGLSYQVLETLRVQTGESAEHLGVHSYVPRLASFDLAGQGYLYSEYNRWDERLHTVSSCYRREVRSAGAAWAEMDGASLRSAPASARAEAVLAREFLLGAMPFSLADGRARLAWAGEAVLGDRKLEVYRLQLAKPVVMEDAEPIAEFLLHVEPHSAQVVQLSYELTGADRDDYEQPRTRAHVDFDGRIGAGKIFLPHKRHGWHAGGQRQREWWSAVPAQLPPPPEALRRPWLSGQLWSPGGRADHWDRPNSPAVPGPDSRPGAR